MKQLNRARNNVRPNSTALLNAKVLRLVTAIEDMFATELPVGGGAYRQDSMLRVIVKDLSNRLRFTLDASRSEK